MTAVSIYDRLYVTGHSDRRIQLTCRWASGMKPAAASRDGSNAASNLDVLPRDRDNLVWKAVDRLRHRAGIDAGIRLDLVKRIPSAAGLGGASSDAAAALTAANRLWGLGWSVGQLAEVGAELGSDVPFFLTARQRGAGMAVCRGRGEQIQPLSGMPRLHVVIVRPPVGLSTPQVYAGCRVPDRPRSCDELTGSLRQGSLRQGSFAPRSLFNRLEESATQLSPWIERLRSEFAGADCLDHLMSGSGSSYFGICRSSRQARRLASCIRARGIGQTFQAVTVPFSHRVEAAPL